ncbi:MAG: DUF4880 domain-containing protein [Rubrivivax sp.]|nr:MAG: DUF4880 domain-containing protein [Rubrivivax sp.]
MTRAAHDDSDVVWEAAVEWLVREHEQPLDAPALAERQAWLDRSPEHRQAYAEAHHVWLLTGLIPPSR